MLNGTYLGGATLERANLARASLSGAVLSHANLRNANLNGADLSNSDLSGANLSGASLRFARLLGARMEGADVAGADFDYARLAGAKLGGVVFEVRQRSLLTSPRAEPLAQADTILYLPPFPTAYSLTGHLASATSIAFSPNGKMLATASYDSSARLWDVKTGKPLAVFFPSRNGWLCWHFDQNGYRADSAGLETFWLIDPAHPERLWHPADLRPEFDLDLREKIA